MGYYYYLARPDNHTLCDLGKAGDWHDALERYPGAVTDRGRHWTIKFTPTDAALLAHLLRSMNTFAWGSVEDDDPGYWDRACERIVRWADGHEVIFLGESHPLLDSDDSPYQYYLVPGD